jgi:hypothetical protein
MQDFFFYFFLLTCCLKSLVYYFIRSLIHRPAVCFGEEHLRSPSVLAIADSSKHIIQILELLDERRLCLSVAINRRELVSSTGLGLLWQSIGLKPDSKLVKESQKVLTTVIDQLESESSAAAAEFSTLASVLVSLDSKHATKSKSQAMSPPLLKPFKSPKKQLEAWKARLMGSVSPNQPRKQETLSRRNSVSGSSPSLLERQMRSPSWASLPPDNFQPHIPLGKSLYHPATGYDNNRSTSCSVPTGPPSGGMSLSDWEFVVSDMDQGFSNIFTGIYGGKECGEDHGPFASLTAEYMQKQGPGMVPLPTSHSELQGLSPEAWSATSSSDIPHQQELATRSVYSDESLGGGEDGPSLPNVRFSLEERASNLLDPLQGLMIPAGDDEIDEFGLVNGWDRRLAV